MKTYNCKVRLNGSLLNVVRKKSITAAEIVMLRHIHGQSAEANDPVFDIEPAGEIKRAERDERARLGSMYSMGETLGPKLVQELLGVAGVPLPQWIDGVDSPDDEQPVEEAAPVAAEPATTVKPKRTRVAPTPAEEATAA